MSDLDYPKVIIALLEHFIESEGTDYLGRQGTVEADYIFTTLNQKEREELTRLRDIARRNVGWSGYEKSA